MATLRPTEPCISGMAILDLRAAMVELVGAECVHGAIASVSAQTRTEYTSATPLSWVRYEALTEVHEAIADRANVPIDDLVVRAIPIAIERSFKTVWRIFLRFTSDEAVIQRTPVLYARSRSVGEMTARRTGPGEGEAVVSKWAKIPDRDIASLRVSIQCFMTLAGRTRVSVASERTTDGARFRVRWDAKGS